MEIQDKKTLPKIKCIDCQENVPEKYIYDKVLELINNPNETKIEN